jgi:hypothetical protein
MPHPLGQEVDHVAAEQLDRAAQDDRGGHAVDVVVAVHRDALFPRDRAHQAIDGRREIGESIRIVEMIEGRSEEARRLFRITEPAEAQQPRDDLRHFDRIREPLRVVIIAGLTFPSECTQYVSPTLMWAPYVAPVSTSTNSMPRRPMLRNLSYRRCIRSSSDQVETSASAAVSGPSSIRAASSGS